MHGIPSSSTDPLAGKVAQLPCRYPVSLVARVPPCRENTGKVYLYTLKDTRNKLLKWSGSRQATSLNFWNGYFSSPDNITLTPAAQHRPFPIIDHQYNILITSSARIIRYHNVSPLQSFFESSFDILGESWLRSFLKHDSQSSYSSHSPASESASTPSKAY